ncbi:sensor histidine kinase [Xylanimonas sp. McL0601]|uniref:sensor histidine kinase n=1 Tax=Xylanimonas sp. McL0601 TaxID=3414739 RepID=UPI003CF6495C
MWLTIAALCTWLMAALPGDETLPYHIAWASFALLYAIGDWRLSWAVSGLALCTVATGAVLMSAALNGFVPWQEATEIPLMSVLMVLSVWHVRRRQLALQSVTAMAQEAQELAANRERLTRLTSHEMRTPLTIARGYVEVLHERTADPEERRDLAVVADELSRLTRVTDRLMRAIRMQGGADLTRVDVDAVLQETAERWAQVVDRRWVVEAEAGYIRGARERLRAALDTLVENAVRYTDDGDVVRLTGRIGPGGWIEIGVGDSGPGLSQELVAAINTGAVEATPSADGLSQNGLGLGIVRGLVAARGGRVRAGVSVDGGALLLMQFPARPQTGRPALDGEGDGVREGDAGRTRLATAQEG